jgi:hypothetical protein
MSIGKSRHHPNKGGTTPQWRSRYSTAIVAERSAVTAAARIKPSVQRQPRLRALLSLSKKGHRTPALEAVESRKTIADRIVNPNNMMTNNAKCRICGMTH